MLLKIFIALLAEVSHSCLVTPTSRRIRTFFSKVDFVGQDSVGYYWLSYPVFQGASVRRKAEQEGWGVSRSGLCLESDSLITN